MDISIMAGTLSIHYQARCEESDRFWSLPAFAFIWVGFLAQAWVRDDVHHDDNDETKKLQNKDQDVQ